VHQRRYARFLALSPEFPLALALLYGYNKDTDAKGLHMAQITIVGDGPGGLSAALFLARSDNEVRVYGTDATVMHFAFLNNYLGIDAISGTDFQTVAKKQVKDSGATLFEQEVESVTIESGTITVVTAAEAHSPDFLVLSEGKAMPIAQSLGIPVLAGDDELVPVDQNGQTSIPNVYVIGRSARPTRSQAIISAGDGAAAALDILSTIEGREVQDWDSPPKG